MHILVKCYVGFSDFGPTSRAFPKFESYGPFETAAFHGWKVKDAIEWFHGIGRLETTRGAEAGAVSEAETERKTHLCVPLAQ